MRVPVAVAQVPVCWSVRRNVGTVLDAIGGVAVGTVLALPAAGQTEIARHTIDLAATRDGYLSQQRGDLIAVSYRPGQAGVAGVAAG